MLAVAVAALATARQRLLIIPFAVELSAKEWARWPGLLGLAQGRWGGGMISSPPRRTRRGSAALAA
jgi:hypothetical protein